MKKKNAKENRFLNLKNNGHGWNHKSNPRDRMKNISRVHRNGAEYEYKQYRISLKINPKKKYIYMNIKYNIE